MKLGQPPTRASGYISTLLPRLYASPELKPCSTRYQPPPLFSTNTPPQTTQQIFSLSSHPRTLRRSRTSAGDQAAEILPPPAPPAKGQHPDAAQSPKAPPSTAAFPRAAASGGQGGTGTANPSGMRRRSSGEGERASVWPGGRAGAGAGAMPRR